MISLNNVGIEFSAHPLFQDISFVINSNEKIALTGKNGAGKSTLLKIMAGLATPTYGSLSKPGEIKISYLPQQMNVADNTSLFEETKKAFENQNILKEEIKIISSKIEGFHQFDSKEYNELIDRLSFLNERLEIMGVSNIDAEIESTLKGLGFKREDFDRPTSEFSGGWRMRIELAKILLQRPDVLLLDEPTNHLDIDSILWLEQFILTKSKAVIIVSHDRTFLDNVTNRTIEISCGRAYDYKVNYSKFIELRKERINQQIRAYNNQQKEIDDIKTFIERFRYQATKANQVQSRIKQLEKIVPIEIDEIDNSRLRLKFPPSLRSGDFPLILENVGKAYGSHKVFDNAEFIIRRGEKVAFVGKNGEGKSTLVKCIMGEVPYTGNLKIGHNVKIGYFAQNQAQLLDENLTVYETIDNVATGDMRTKVKDILGAFMFGGESIEKKVKVLSGGEKTRLAMIKLLLEPVNFLILDEPTNHLDISTKDILKEAIKDFDGTVIIVSHDRDFLDGLVEKVYEFGEGKIKENLGGIYDFLRKKNLENLKQLEISRNEKNNIKSVEKEECEISSGKLNYFVQKEFAKNVNKAKRVLEKCESQVEMLENKLKELEKKISDGNITEIILDSYSQTKSELDTAMSLWEEASLNLEKLNI